MKLLARNNIFALLSLSRFLNTLGAAIYNLVFVVFAASMPQPSLAVGIANLIVFIPSLFTIFIGMKADRTKKKANWLIRIGYLQAILFILCSHDQDSGLPSLFDCLLFKHCFRLFERLSRRLATPYHEKEHPRRGFDGGLFLQPTT